MLFMSNFPAQLNKNMPRTFGDALVHQSHFDYAVQIDCPLPEHGGKPPSENEKKIGQYIANELVDDGATLQMGNLVFLLFFYYYYFKIFRQYLFLIKLMYIYIYMYIY